MPIGIPAAMLIGSAVAGGSSLAAGVLGSSAAKSAAATQSSTALSTAQAQAAASKYAVDAQTKQAQDANQLTRDTQAQQQQNLQPWLDAGKGALSTLTSDMLPGGSLSQTFSGKMPTAVDPNQYKFDPSTVQFDPGFQARMDLANKELNNSAAAGGTLRSGAQAKALVKYNQTEASNEYGAAYQRAQDQNNQNYGRATNQYGEQLTNYQQAYNEFLNNQNNTYNRLANIAGLGQTATGNLNQLLGTATTNVNNTNANATTQSNQLTTQSAANTAQAQQAAAAAAAAGTVGSANAYGNALSGVAQSASNLALLQMMNQGRQNQNQSSYVPVYPGTAQSYGNN